ncbi:hypothetical protein LKR43_04810 [Pusillimonas sp. MFBS29]|uniref:hypothetical protein n=1 Tax=Pusillimonas sp. MFBS29 TaxID=2886690 RepID=UPI001D0FBBA0|nr:hypothetical protein [Pusillimonas sp. MFBS29]MCC2595657.1 hypothetical protein [Pusillimonas sp. MFBS29]
MKLEALLSRWVEREESHYAAELESNPTPERRVKLHLSQTEHESLSAGIAVCTMLAALSGNAEMCTAMQNWYM